MLQLKCCILDTFMMPAGVRVRKHWWPQSKLSTLKTTTSANFNLANVYNFWNKTRYKIHVVKGRELLQPNQVPFQHGHLSFYLPPFHFVWWLFDSLAIFIRYTSFKFVFTKHDRKFFLRKRRKRNRGHFKALLSYKLFLNLALFKKTYRTEILRFCRCQWCNISA